MKKLTSKISIHVLILIGAWVPGAATAQTTSCDGDVYNCFILRVDTETYSSVLSNHALTWEADVRTGDPKLVLVTGPTNTLPETTLANVQADTDVLGFEMVASQAMTEGATGAGVDQSHTGIVDAMNMTGTSTGSQNAYFDVDPWNGYVNQPASAIMNLAAAHADPRPEALGLGVVAVIDTGIDPDHPLLTGALVAGYDFILEQAGNASEWNALDPATYPNAEQDLNFVADQSHTGIVDGDGVAFIEQSHTGIVDQSHTGIVDQSHTGIVDALDLPPGFGHGTMVAGLVRWVAPAAMIMPLRVFDEWGQGNLGDIVRAIYYAVDNGADVINMSFSTETHSTELLEAVNYAHQNGVVMISSAGNEGKGKPTYPAALGNVISVASTDHSDVQSDFTNWSPAHVTLAATGEALITTFPGGGYAAASGTSFSAAVVAGTIALLHDANGGSMIPVNFFQAAQALTASAVDVANHKLGAGRTDIDHAMNCGPTGGTCNP